MLEFELILVTFDVGAHLKYSNYMILTCNIFGIFSSISSVVFGFINERFTQQIVCNLL
jgi:hypothetical protein